ncbi:MAG: family 78 glycoside hydrolase catalytic domain [Clostridiaceae bacterium]|nr:family 78 glycoside hydrolase catalytic domain [Clostridiaceae bacterium]
MTGIVPSALRIDSGRHHEDMVVGNASPVFSWAIAGSRTLSQAVCRLELACGDTCAWDSGWTVSSEPGLAYAGPPLCSGTRYDVFIQLRDAAGHLGRRVGWSFRTGLFETWPAPWIAPQDDCGDAAMVFAVDLDLAGRRPAWGVLYCCGIGYQQIRINQALVAPQDRLSPAFSAYHKRCYYTVHGGLDQLLTDGSNRLEITVAQGWRRNMGPYLHNKGVPFFGSPQLTAILDIGYADGTTRRIQTGPDWQCRRGPVVSSHLFDGETYDARLEGTSLPAEPCRIVAAPGEAVTMCPQELEPIRVQRKYDPIAVHDVADGTIFDLGQNIAGVCAIHLPPDLPAGLEIRLTHAEELDETGNLYRAPLRGARAEDCYVTGPATGLPVTWSPSFTYHGFRYVKVSGLPYTPERDFLTGLLLYTAIDSASSFRCGSPIANHLQHMVVMTERDNLHSIATDCPQRDERMGWLNDATVRFEELPYNFDAGRLFPKIVRDIADEQEDGAIGCTAPFVYGHRPADPVCSSFLVAAQMSYLHYGNRALLEEAYPALAAWNDCLARQTRDGLVTYSHYGDWAGPQDSCAGDSPRSAVTPGVYMSTGYHYLNDRLLAEFARVLGKEADARSHEQRAEATRQAMLAAWLREDGTMATGSQACQAFALRLGMLPEPLRPAAAARMHQAVLDAGGRLTTGNLCTLYLLEMLAEYGYIDTAWDLITRETYPSWGFMMQNEATTVWERFELKKDPGMNSHCHPMYGAVGKWLYSHIAGIVPVGPGFREVHIRPYFPERLSSAQATVATCRGDVSVHWHKSYGQLRLQVTIPNGMDAWIEAGNIRETVRGGTYRWLL